ncbi:hypothetical protein ACYOEI_05010 [Singulisphaera rosea]
MSRNSFMKLAVGTAFLLGTTGCGGGVPPAGSRAVVPADYKEKEKIMAEGFKNMMKQRAATTKVKARRTR